MNELHLRVFRNKSELVLPDGTVQVFLEGGMSQSARLRYQKIATGLANRYLEQILLCRNSFTEQSDYADRNMKIAIHSWMQAMQKYQFFTNASLKPLYRCGQLIKNMVISAILKYSKIDKLLKLGMQNMAKIQSPAKFA